MLKCVILPWVKAPSMGDSNPELTPEAKRNIYLLHRFSNKMNTARFLLNT